MYCSIVWSEETIWNQNVIIWRDRKHAREACNYGGGDVIAGVRSFQGIWRVIVSYSPGCSSIEVASGSCGLSKPNIPRRYRLILLPASVTLRNYHALVHLHFVLKNRVMNLLPSSELLSTNGQQRYISLTDTATFLVKLLGITTHPILLCNPEVHHSVCKSLLL
jgi:hypothetical protein